MEEYNKSVEIVKENYTDLTNKLTEELYIYNLTRNQIELLSIIGYDNYSINLDNKNIKECTRILINTANLCLNMEILNLKKDKMSIINKNKDIFICKNKDYGNSFMDFGLIGILVRLNDKINRLKSLMKNEIKVKDEKKEDTINDLYNYCIMGLSLK
jgi:hypothetical protein